VVDKWSVGRQSALAVEDAHSIFICIGKSIASGWREVILPSARRWWDMPGVLCVALLSCEERLRALRLFSLKKRRRGSGRILSICINTKLSKDVGSKRLWD